MQSTGDRGSTPPNFLIVILDCARAADMPGGSTPIPGMTFAESLRKESIVYPNAVAPAPWTIPSHASLFTGLYPWEHGTHLKRSLRLDPAIPTLPGTLGAHGYATFAASSNGFISPDFGLVNGFSAAAWGEWWERFLHLPSDLPPRAHHFGPTMRLPDSPLWKALESPARYMNRRPILLDAVNKFTAQLKTPGRPYSPFISPWIERSVDSWLGQQPAQKPVFCFVNYYEAHEPYIIDRSQIPGGMSLSEIAGLRMDRTNFLANRWKPTASEFKSLYRLYRSVVQALDDRLRRLAKAFQDHDRWENTVVLLASDHGQAFGENGFVFHGVRVWEPVVRIPLWLRLPRGERAGTSAVGWASLIDVMPTFLDLAHVPGPVFPSAHSLLDLVDRPRLQPVMSASDGTPARKTLRKLVSEEVVEFWDQPYVAAYQDGHKVILNVPADTTQVFDLAVDPNETHDLGLEARGHLGPLVDVARRAGRQLLNRPEEVRPNELDDRLRSWGYE